MTFLLFLKALFVGFIISFPIGPIGILCLRRMLSDGPLVGLASGLGAATADALYSFVATMGLSFISNFIVIHQIFFRFVGGLVLIALGTTIIISKPQVKLSSTRHTDIVHGYFSTFFLTLTNPITLFSFIAIFAILGISVESIENISQVLIVIIGVFLGSALWWLSMAGSIVFLRLQINIAMMKFINIGVGIFIIICGAVALFSLLGSPSVIRDVCQVIAE